jgi:hypothetical protein
MTAADTLPVGYREHQATGDEERHQSDQRREGRSADADQDVQGVVDDGRGVTR